MQCLRRRFNTKEEEVINSVIVVKNMEFTLNYLS